MSITLESTPTSSFARWFRRTFIFVGCIEVFFATMTIVQGPSKVMSQFGIPEVVVLSPHYSDAMLWVVLHMCFIGMICISIGMMVRDIRAQRWFARIFVLFHSVYAYLDVRASDSALGTALYQGPLSLVTPAISCALLLVILHLAIRSFGKE